MKILLTGKNGQVGFELQRALAAIGKVYPVDVADCNLADEKAIRQLVQSVRPDVIINPAAYTAVDKAESKPALAVAINTRAPAVLGEEAAKIGPLVVHFSTDYVFDGTKSGPYTEDDPSNPQSVYGLTKSDGELALQQSGADHLIFRTSWVVGAHGANFAKTMLRPTQKFSAMKNLYSITLILLCLYALNSNKANAQLVVDTAVSVNMMMDDFFDNTCVNISNVTYNGAPLAVGFFDASSTNLGINAGFLMTSGSVYNAIGPNDNSGISMLNNTNGDDDLNGLTGFRTYDASVIEMDIIPSLDTLYFKYAFGSEEYTEWVGPVFNDVFAFYVSDPGITGEQNRAVVPGNNDPVSVNSINCVNANQAYYLCNTPADCSGLTDCPNAAGETTLQSDGFTVPITAQVTVIPGETYHVKLAIADAGDGILDSGIFIGVDSLCGDGQLKPIPGFTATVNDNEVQFYNQSRYATSFNWNFGDNSTSTEANPVHIYSEPGNYQVTLTVENYCCNSAVTELVNIGTATPIQSPASQLLQIFPNPTDGLLTIETGSNKSGIVKLYNHAGVELNSYSIVSTWDIGSRELMSSAPEGNGRLI